MDNGSPPDEIGRLVGTEIEGMDGELMIAIRIMVAINSTLFFSAEFSNMHWNHANNFSGTIFLVSTICRIIIRRIIINER